MKKVLLFTVLILGILVSGCTSVTPSPVYKTINQNIVDGVIPVEAGKYVYYEFSVPSQASISGDFTAFGGSGNDIIVYILDETSYINP